MSLLGTYNALVPDAERGWPQTAMESAADEFVGRTVDEQGVAIKRLIGVLMGRDFHREVTAAGRPVSDREEVVVVDELRERWLRIAHGGGTDQASRRVAERALRMYEGERP